MVVIVYPTMAVMGHIGAFSNDGCGHGQARRLVILVPLTNSFHSYDDKCTDHQNEYDGEHDAKGIEHTKALIETHSESHF